MSPLLEDLILQVATKGWQEIVHIVIISGIRPFGLIFGFVLFQWSMSQLRMLAIGIAVVFGLPNAVTNLPTILFLTTDASLPRVLFVSFTEVTIGLVLGLAMSMPFLAAEYAGKLPDQFRGETDSGLRGPDQSSVSSTGLLYVLTAFAAFAWADGPAFVVRALYHSYTIWPISSGFPDLSDNALQVALMMFQDMLLLCIRIAVPVLLLLGILEFSVSVAARISRRYSAYNLAFIIKNSAYVITLPLSIALIAMIINTIIADNLLSFNLRAFFGQ